MVERKDEISFGFKFGMDFCLNSIVAVNKGVETLNFIKITHSASLSDPGF